MPIRMVDDPQDPNEFNDNSGGRSGGRGGGGGGLLNLLPLLLMLFRKPGGLLILVLLGGAYFLMNQQGCGSSFLQQAASAFSTGGMLSKQEFAKAPVYEGLSDDDIRNPLPEYVSLAKFAPDRQNQGKQGSCVAWSSAYAAQTILMSASSGINPNQLAFSPSYMYNQIGLDGCQGSYIIRAMELMQRKGGVPFNNFPYDETDCSRNPPTSLDALAAANKIHGFNRLTGSDAPEGISIRAIKEHLASGAPVVIGMMVGGSFMEGMMGQKVWMPTQSDYNQMGFGGHAMSVIGYDDKLAGGAFQIMNSWGPEWGENGIGWVRYADFKEFVREAYGIDPLPQQGAALQQAFDCEIGLVQVDEKAKPAGYIPLRNAGSNLFTSNTIAKGSRFKVEVKNSTECYVYVFGQEVDGSSYTLFPYPTKEDATKTAYTAYCGITGYRLFPKNKSMMPDSIGTKDYIAVVVSKEELPWYELNQNISTPGSNYASNVSNALRSYGSASLQVSSTGNGNLRFTAAAGAKSVSYAIVEINKK
ncbi:MAG: peptidase C1A papain [Bacteroidetes bacterium]|uniref:C1 family peptidase n=1 Tax=Phnomibacter sp. TaxID=2836217 RepID=UPI002FDDFC5B|nr:peptidase C1A papain [Bacteroidota bacterium]